MTGREGMPRVSTSLGVPASVTLNHALCWGGEGLGETLGKTGPTGPARLLRGWGTGESSGGEGCCFPQWGLLSPALLSTSAGAAFLELGWSCGSSLTEPSFCPALATLLTTNYSGEGPSHRVLSSL